jgi:hypothetical protein
MISGTRIAAILLLFSSVIACSDKPDCLVADSLKEMTAPSLNEKGLHIFLRTSGFNEKEHFYEMYKGMPAFDSCGRTGSSLISLVHIDRSIGYAQKLIVKDNRMEIVYSDDESSRPADAIPVEVE